MPYLVKKLPGGNHTYKMRDADGVMKEITAIGTIFNFEPQPDPFTSIEKIGAGGVARHLELIARSEKKKAAQDLRETRTNKAAKVIERFEILVSPLDPEQRASMVQSYADDENYREKLDGEIEKRASAEDARRAKAKKAIDARRALDETIGDYMSNGNIDIKDRREYCAKLKLDFERGVFMARIRDAADVGDEDAVKLLTRAMEEQYPLDEKPADPATQEQTPGG